ncbi:hypothetical protein ABZ639_29245 [Saccharomonospora sp. NPDC006951]
MDLSGRDRSGGRATRLWRRLYPGRNPLARGSDRLEGRLLVVFLLLSLIALPIAATVGSNTYAARLTDVEREAGLKHRATAELLADAPVTAPAGDVETVKVQARWRLPDGTERVGTLATYRGSVKGTKIPVWLDNAGNLTSPPATKVAAATDGVSVGVSLWFGVVMLFCLVFFTFRAVVARMRAAQWAREWARVERQWSRR